MTAEQEREAGMIRCRFQQPTDDPRPAVWPVKHPYWVTGYGDDYAIIVAYADDEAEILRNWPEARELDSQPVSDYVFTDRFRRPDWFLSRNPDNPQNEG